MTDLSLRRFVNKISVVIPTFNEKGNIVLLINQIQKTVALYSIPFEIIIVDDNSPDNTALEVRKKIKNNQLVKLFLRKNERGLASAILFGIKKAKGEIIIGMDADFNHPPQLIPKLINQIKNYDFVVASRFIKGGGMEDKLRYFFTLLFNFFLKYILGFPTMDNMSGFNAIKRKKLFSLPLEKIYQGYGEYHLRLLWYAKKHGLKIKEIPVYYPKRKFGESKSNLFKMFFSYFYTALKLKFKIFSNH